MKPRLRSRRSRRSNRPRLTEWFEHMFTLLAAAGLGFLFLCAVFRPLEMAYPARPQRLFRPAWLTDLCFFLGQYLLWGGVVLWILSYFGNWLDGVVPQTFRQTVASQPWW